MKLANRFAFALFWFFASLVQAQTNYTLNWSTIDGGAGTSTGGVFSLSGTIGQPDAGRTSGGNYTLMGGFWGVITAVQTPGAPLLSIRLSNPSSPVVAWPYPSTGYWLQQSTSLDATNWMSATNVPVRTGDEWQVAISPLTGNRFYRLRMAGTTNMAFIPSGSFTMGSPTNEVDRDTDEGPQTTVTISRSFWMGKYEVTQGEYLSVMGSNPSHFTGDLNRPVESVTWGDATNYCAMLTQRELTAGRISVGDRYRLATEAEWEYACRAGATTRFSYGDDPGYTNLTNYAWYSENSGSAGTHPVGQKLPNSWGLYDMGGNAWEWCQDWYGAYSGGAVTDPQGAATGVLRVLRGGGYFYAGPRCLPANRDGNSVSYQNSDVGFRVVLAPSQP